MQNNEKKFNIDRFVKITMRIVALVFVLVFIAMIGFAIAYGINVSPVNPDDKTEIHFTVEKGWGSSKIADELEKNKLIKSSFFFKIYIKMTEDKDFLAGTYTISKSMTVDEIVDTLTEGKALEEKGISITFVEGQGMKYYASRIAANYNYTEEEVMNFVNDKEFVNKMINKYWFITDEVLNSEIKYPLEGYLYPETYTFKKDATLENIFMTLLDQMDKVLTTYKKDIEKNGKSIHSLLTMASVVELEAVSQEDRLEVSGVFYNRLNVGMRLGSDVTSYYAAGKSMKEKIYTSELNSCSPYNTRGTCGASGLPIGPICSPSKTSIIAAINPKETEAYYFVADSNRKVYFSKTANEQAQVIAELKRTNKWPI